MEVLLIRDGNRLAPADPISEESIRQLKNGETVTANLRRPRNPRHHKLLFALLKIVYENQEAYPTTQELLSAIKMATGLFDTGKTVDGIPYAIPKSISFASMDQTSFAEWYDKALDVIITKIIPGLDKEGLREEVLSIIEIQENKRSA